MKSNQYPRSAAYGCHDPAVYYCTNEGFNFLWPSSFIPSPLPSTLVLTAQPLDSLRKCAQVTQFIIIFFWSFKYFPTFPSNLPIWRHWKGSWPSRGWPWNQMRCHSFVRISDPLGDREGAEKSRLRSWVLGVKWRLEPDGSNVYDYLQMSQSTA